uniref:Uncharacterized protein n=1 Tax=Physcomitrium patens TaxID=3218 RepID=A0A7I4B6Z7_PHYPA|nr:uncharacterized protein LOC112293929 isoform X3 [Physcomitrium patens]|eukprot:XP_024399699.1 uncharacterized protein LOC112293929 isoform X3 [Physcomitrella patens]
MARGSARGRGRGRSRGRGRGAAAIASAVAADAEVESHNQATAEHVSPLSSSLEAYNPHKLASIPQSETLSLTEVLRHKAIGVTVIYSEPDVENNIERRFVSEEQGTSIPPEFGDTPSIICKNVAGNGVDALFDPSKPGLVRSANGEEMMVENVQTAVEAVKSVEPVSENAVGTLSHVDPSIIDTSLITTQETHETMKEVPLRRGGNGSAAFESMKEEPIEVVCEEGVVQKTLNKPSVVKPIFARNVDLKAEVMSISTKMEVYNVKLEETHVTVDLEPVKLKVGGERTNSDLSVDRLEKGNDPPLESAGIVRESSEQDFYGEIDDTLGGIEERYEDHDEDKDGYLEGSKESLSGEAVDYDAEAQHPLPLSDRRKHKRLEVYVGGLDKDTTEEDLKSLFKKAGEVIEIRLMRNPQTGKNKGFAFIRYASAAMAKRATEDFETVEIRGRQCTAKPSEENDTLHLGNINKSWKKEMVLETLKSLSIESIEELTLMEDPQVEGVNRGFAFIEFSTHKDALDAFRKLQQPDAIFGTERSAKVAWAQPLYEPDEDTMSQVKSVFVDGMPLTWEEGNVREHFGKYGEIERIVLARNMLSAKRKDFGFVNYMERNAALTCIDALNNTEIIDGDMKMKVKVVLAKPQVKSKFGKGVREGYSLGFRGDYRVGTSPSRVGRGSTNGMGSGARDASSWGNSVSSGNHLKLDGVREVEADSKLLKEKLNHDILDHKCQFSSPMQDQATEDSVLLGTEGKRMFPDFEQTEGAYLVSSGGSSVQAENLSSTAAEIIAKPTLDKFECAICGFGSDSPDDLEAHKKTKVHRVIEDLRKDQKLHNKTPLSLLHEYSSRNHCEVTYDTKAETNGPFEVIAIIGGAAGGTTGPPTKGFGSGRNKARAKQMAAADALEKIMELVPESEFTKPGQSRQRFGDRDRPGRKGKSGGWTGGGSGGGRVGGGGSNAYRNPRERPNDDWTYAATSINVPGAPRFGGVSGVRTRQPDGNTSYMGCGGGGVVGGSYPSSPNTTPITGFSNDVLRAATHNGYVDKYVGRGGTGYSVSSRGGRGGLPSHPETYAERYDRIQGGRGYGGGAYAGREYFGGVGVGGGGNSYVGRDVGGTSYGGRELPAALGYGGRELHPGGGHGGSSRNFERAGIKRPYAVMDEDTRYLDTQRGLPRQRLEAMEHVSIQQNGGVQGYGAQPMFSDAARVPIIQQPIYMDASRTAFVRPQEQSQHNAYVQQSQGLPVVHTVGPTQQISAYLSTQHVPSQHVPLQHITAQHLSTQHAQTQHVPAHVHNQQTTIPIAVIGGPGQGGTAYSTYDAASQSTELGRRLLIHIVNNMLLPHITMLVILSTRNTWLILRFRSRRRPKQIHIQGNQHMQLSMV